MTLRAGDWVEVRSKEEIFATLDENGRLEGLPFMPQMLQYCGRRFQVFKRAGKTCSEVRGPAGVVYVPRRLHDTVHLEHRCDGRAYGGCQAGCLIFWKEAWLKRVGAITVDTSARVVARSSPAPGRRLLHRGSSSCGNHVSWAGRRCQVLVPSHPVDGSHHSPQVVGRPAIRRSLSLRQQFPEHCTEEHCISALLLRHAGAFAALGCRVALAYDRFQSIWGGFPFPRKPGKIAAGQTHSQARSGAEAGRTGAGEDRTSRYLRRWTRPLSIVASVSTPSSSPIAARYSGYARASSASSMKRPERCSR